MIKPDRLDGMTRPDLPVSHYLDNRIYTDTDVFAQERDCIFSQRWKFVCHSSEINESGDYRLVNVAGCELILLRGKDNIIRSFHNSCAHRGARIIRKPAGNLKDGNMTCFYHLWSYDSQGRCVTISQPAGYKKSGVSKDTTALREVRVESIYNLLFVCLDDNVESLQNYLGEEVIEEIRIPFGEADLEVFHFHRTELKANWKMFVETNCEGYHELLHVLNRTTGVAFEDYRKRQWKCHAGGHISLEQAKIEYDQHKFDDRDSHTLPGMQPSGHVVVDLFPDMMLNCRSTVVRIDSLIPITPDRTILECRGLGVRGDSESVRAERIRHHNQVWGPTGTNLAEDVWAVETQMQNMISGASQYSVIAREESGPMTDAPLREFYAEWSRLTGIQPNQLGSEPENSVQ
ncbi:MAG: aromatic ring-hydroxylating dioxygenase subunit alpha [Gammaproteobacteria bacterium]|jgi:methanesulfonate monooxygenase subunit alpha|nr:aromatic ring-hydroxylating dioxygenase subunit alpha [Gammaproteobacteria bacterium]